ncbi:hypothetical protein O181_046437 [Austropuccinia psidii MF-1]|uniref:Uncharacterized protein n=1 Tax=Austropuccinia psidii MF-1 TaxID=1389203 RepID=A0A9Q3DR94_9BASI|nr:hypothetical protein [Austropuccinia psidii MF-1]
MTPSRSHWVFSFTVLLQRNTGSSFSLDTQEEVPKTIFQVSMLHQSTLATTFIQYSMDSSRPVFSIIHHGKIIQPSSTLIWARYTFHQTINAASSIQYRPASTLKESIYQPFTYTSLP